jgi:LAO/AO transport system kinase
MVPGYGDSLQAMKAGITEIADVVVVNKADTPGAEQAAKELSSQGFEREAPAGGAPWPVPVVLTSALRNDGIDRLVECLDDHFAFTGESGARAHVERRRQRARFSAFVQDHLRDELLNSLEADCDGAVLADPYGAAEEYVERLLKAHSTITPGPSGSGTSEMEKQ